MKIAVISPNPAHLADIGKALAAAAHVPVLLEGGKSRMRQVAQQERPDILMVDGMCCNVAELAQVERVTAEHPGLAVVLLCASATPEFLINSMRAGVREVLPSPADDAALLAVVNRIARRAATAIPRAAGKVLAFLPCHGGSGATFIATNLGAQLGESASVLLIDLNLQFGDALSFVHDGKPGSTVADVAREIARLDASFLAASAVRVTPNFAVLAAPEDPAEAIEVKPEHLEAIIALASASYDYVLLDMGRHFDTMAVRCLDQATTIYAVLQASIPALRNARRMLDVFRSLGYAPEKVELVLNRFEKGGAIGVAEIERSLGRMPVHTVSNSYRHVMASINHGGPLAASGRANPVSRSLAQFARELGPQDEAGRATMFGRLFGRLGAAG